jgi:hypothetical protein
MNVQVQPHVTTAQRHFPFECVALVLQGAVRLRAIRPASMRSLQRPASNPTGSPASRSGLSMRPSLPAIRRIPASISYANFGPK